MALGVRDAIVNKTKKEPTFRVISVSIKPKA